MFWIGDVFVEEDLNVSTKNLRMLIKLDPGQTSELVKGRKMEKILLVEILRNCKSVIFNF